MKTIIERLLLVLLLLVGLAPSIKADNEEFDNNHEYNFMCYKNGQYALHFKVLAWSSGGYNHWAADGSKVYVNIDGTDYVLAEYYTNNDACKGSGDAKVYMKTHDYGSYTVTNCSDGEDRKINGGQSNFSSYSIKHSDMSRSQVYLEFTWYIPNNDTRFNGKTATAKCFVHDARRIWSDSYYTHNMGTFDLADSIAAPQLYTPSFYPNTSTDSFAVAKIMVPYSVTTKPVSYHTSFNPNKEIPCTDMGGLIYVEATDEEQTNFYIEMTVQRDDNTTVQVKSNTVSIPAYHKIYDFSATPYHGEKDNEPYRGYKKLSWTIKTPKQYDVMSADMFEVERACLADFSDAKVVENISFIDFSTDTTDVSNLKSYTYTYVDSTADVEFNSYDVEKPMYYRLVRASAYTSGWNNQYYTAKDSVTEVLAQPLLVYDYYKSSSTSRFAAKVEKDANYETNRKVHFTIPIGEDYSDYFSGHYQWWDKRSRLLLTRHVRENSKLDVTKVIPADSIDIARSGSDGNYNVVYLAHFNDSPETPCYHYYYTVSIDTTRTQYARLKSSIGTYDEVKMPMPADSLYFDNAPTIATFTASQGTDSRSVNLAWTLDGGGADYYIVERAKSGFKYDTIATKITDQYFLDSLAVPGVQYTYRVTAVVNCSSLKETTKTTTGYRSPYGRITGKVRFTNGIAVAGITVVATRKESSGSYYTNPNGSATKHTDSFTATTAEDGTFVMDSVAYTTDGSTFEITVSSEKLIFTCNGEATVDRTVNTEQPVNSNIVFESSDYVRLTGRVLFDGTTVPVHNAQFKLNGAVVKSTTGTPITADASGNFEVSVPKDVSFTFQAVMAGHTFKNDGYVLINNSKTISLSKAQYGVRIWDQTRVKLVGRVVGGTVQGSQPLGFGKSKNNLGDNLQFVLQLEGDNISELVYDEKDKTLSERDTVYNHAVADQCTKVHTTKTRIIIRPDSITGEYLAELYPVKYKITQATAKGYSTLFNSELGTQTIDLTSKLKADTLRFGSLEQPYNETYSIIYRAAPSITAQQYVNGQNVDYLGEQKMSQMTLAGTVEDIPLIKKDTAGVYSYTFGHPVFASGYRYLVQISGHEDYYYNNETTKAPDRVMLKGNKVKIYNGLASASASQEATLSDRGIAWVYLNATNPYFAVTGDSALRCIDMSVLVDGEYVKADPIQAYVTGSHTSGRDIRQKLGSKIILNDVLRDPPGSGSYAYIKEGTKYHTEYTLVQTMSYGVNLTLILGSKYQTIVGMLMGGATFNGWSMDGQEVTTKTFPLYKTDRYENKYQYDFETTDEIQTGSAPSQVGSMAHVYIGSEAAAYAVTQESFCAVDSATHARLLPAIKAGTVKEVASGVDAKGTPYYMVIAQQLAMTSGMDSKFAYTQKHIVTQIIPQLYADRNSLLRQGSEAELQEIANTTKKPVYRSLVDSDNELYGQKDGYQVMIPSSTDSLAVVDEIAQYNSLMAQWIQIIATNENTEVNGCPDAMLLNTYSVSDGAKISHCETATYSAGYQNKLNKTDWTGLFTNIGASITTTAAHTIGAGIFKDVFKGMNYDGIFKAFKTYMDGSQKLGQNYQSKNDGGTESTAFTPGMSFDFKFEPIVSYDETETNYVTKVQNKTSGFVLQEGANGYLNVSVYRITDNEWNDSTSHKDWRTMANDVNSEMATNTDYLYADYVYYLNGGATRCPYEGADSTLFYLTGTPLSPATLKIDKPMMETSIHSVNDVPEDQSAIYNIRLWNDSEVNDAVNFTTGEYKLYLDPYSNTKGAVVTMDGVNLEMGTSVFLTRGTVLNKVVEVKRGTAYDYDDIVLCMAPACDLEYGNTSNLTSVKLAAHFMPSSSDVAITSPSDGWVLNTDSSHDSTGYYIPVVIEGFDYNYNNFDHIEFQYKLNTDGDDSWVNLCSYFVNDSLYAAASGNKDHITSGILKTAFYGERDPMEQKYDLRAVTFCRLGNGFVTKSSKVLTGMKDTRNPRVFGYPTPTDGILGIGDVLSIPFSEDIAGNYLDEDANFEVTGFTNSTSLTDNTSVLFDGTSDCKAQSEATRSLTKKNLTIDMLVLPDSLNKSRMTYFSHGAGKKKMEFGQTADNRLFFNCCGDEVTSKVFKSMAGFTRVSVTYNTTTGDVHFYIGSADMTGDTHQVVANYICSSKITLGAALDGSTPYIGRMLDARIWTREFSQAEVANYQTKHLTGYERNLLVYYPMNEGKGTVLKDKANGANAQMTGLSWKCPEGRSLYFDANNTKGVTLNNEIFNRNAYSDYTLSCWFKTENATAADTMAIFATGSGQADEANASSKLFVGLEQGSLVVRSNGVPYITKTVADDQEWHHIALTVDRGHNIGALYLDDELVNQFAIDNLGGISSDDVRLGACCKTVSTLESTQKSYLYPFHGYIDDVTFWESALPKDYLTQMDNSAPSGSELNLLAYLAFTKRELNSSSIYETVYNPYNAKIYYDDDHNVVDKQVRLIMDDDATVSKMLSTVSAPITENGELTKLNFSWMFRENELQISLDMPDAEINKNNLFVTVRDVKDLRGNLLQNPVSWTVFVDRNQLKWNDKQLSFMTYKGYSITENIKFTNLCGTSAQYTIENLPDWITSSLSSGTIQPTEELTTKFTISKNLDPGVYSQIIYLTDDNGLSEPLYVTVTILAEKPNWSIDSSLGNTMNVTGQVNIVETDNSTTTSYLDTDEDDLVAAFIDGVCVGLQNISYVNGRSAVYMTLHGDDSMEGKAVTFRLWQSEKGIINSLKAEPSVSFAAQGIVGSPNNPVQFSTTGNVNMNIDLKEGWNWLSFNIEPSSNAETFYNSFSTSYEFSDHDYVKTQGSYAEFLDGEWVGTLTSLTHSNIYMFHLTNAGTVEVVGDPLTEDQKKLTFKKGWNYLPYYPSTTEEITTAMANYFDYATPGDIIKGYDEYAIFSEDNKWEGSLTHMTPGRGYMLYSQTALRTGLSFTYPIVTTDNVRVEGALTKSIFGEYSSNMPIVATVEGQMAEEGGVLEAYDATGKLVGRAPRHADGRYYLLTSAREGAMMSYRLSDAEGNEQARSAAITQFDGTSSIGTVEQPLVLTFSGEQGMSVTPKLFDDQLTFTAVCQPGDNVSMRLYNGTGTLVWSNETTAADAYSTATATGLSGLSKGVYMATIKVGHTPYNFKLIKK